MYMYYILFRITLTIGGLFWKTVPNNENEDNWLTWWDIYTCMNRHTYHVIHTLPILDYNWACLVFRREGYIVFFTDTYDCYLIIVSEMYNDARDVKKKNVIYECCVGTHNWFPTWLCLPWAPLGYVWIDGTRWNGVVWSKVSFLDFKKMNGMEWNLMGCIPSSLPIFLPFGRYRVESFLLTF